MARKTKIQTAVERAEAAQLALAEAQQAAEDAHREAALVLGEAVLEAVSDPKSRWAEHADLSVTEFYELVIGGAEPSTEKRSGRRSKSVSSSGHGAGRHASPEDTDLSDGTSEPSVGSDGSLGF